MAIYHLHAKVIQRSKGKNIIAASAYRRATRLHDQKEERDWDFRAKKDVLYSELMVPENAPTWVQALAELHQYDPSKAAEQLWNALNAAEKRIDAQLAREIEFALPIELNEAQSIYLACAFIRDQFVLRGMIADWSLHWDKGNPHVHVLLTMRALTESGFGRKMLEWNHKALLQTWREKWAEYANFHLHLHQHAVRIDHRSYEAQGIDLIPGIHEGKATREMACRGMDIDRLSDADRIRQLNFTRLIEHCEILFHHLGSSGDTFTYKQIANTLKRYLPHQKYASASHIKQSIEIDTILQAIAQHESVFSEKDLANVLKKSFPQYADELAKVILAIKQSPDVIALGVGNDGKDRFTTCQLFKAENTIQQLADNLKAGFHVSIAESKQNILLDQYQEQSNKILTDEQKSAVLNLLNPTAITCMVGRAGTGKSFCLGAAKSIWEAQGLRVHGIALSGIAADGLSKDVGIPSTTIESFRYRVANQLLTLNPLDVVIMDEAGMTDSLSMLSVLKIVAQAKAKLVLVGDSVQLQPVGPGATFRALVERLGFVEIQQVYRQSVPWQREATVAFSTGAIAKGLASYREKNCIFMEADPDLAMKKLMMNWKSLVQDQNKLSQVLVIAHRNEDINALNSLLRAERVESGKILAGYKVKTVRGEISIAQGDRILFLKNDRKLGVSNGRFATVEFVDFIRSNQVNYFTVKLDGSNQTIAINPYAYNHFTYGYAVTVHKVQGITIDHSLVYAGGKGWNRHLTYVAFSRHRQSCSLYADRETHPQDALFIYRLGRLSLKDSVLDFPLAFAERRGIEPQNNQQKLTAHLAKKLASWKQQIVDKVSKWHMAVDKASEQDVAQKPEQSTSESAAQKKNHAHVNDEEKSQVNKVSAPYQRVDIKRFRADLNARVEQVALHYLDQPKIKQGHTWRYGSNKGSLVVTVQGAKQGLWRDFQCDVGGDMLGLIQHVLEIKDFKVVLQEATRFLGSDSLYRISDSKKSMVSPIKNHDSDEYAKQKIQKAQTIYRGTQPIVGTIAERYLREHRGILGELEDKTFRYHPALKNWMTGSIHPALVVIARDRNDQVCGLQAIFLDTKTAKKSYQLGSYVKLSRGLIGEGAIVHAGKPNNKIALAEGPETALSIAEAQPDWTVYVTFGVSNFAKVRLPENTQNILICADNDGHDSTTSKSITKSAEQLAKRGVDVWVAEPQKPEHKTKWDFNDALMSGGVSQIKNDLDQAKLYQKGISKENFTVDLKENLAVLSEAKSVIEKSAVGKTVSISEITSESLKTLLVRYVEMELEQTRLVNAMHSARLQGSKSGKAASKKALEHADEIQTFAEEVIEHPEIKTILGAKQKIKPPHIANRGGFIGISERLRQGEWSEEDIHLLVKQLRNKVASEALSQMKERNRSTRLR